MRLHLVERSEPLRELQRRRLGRSATWHATLAEALAACEGRACVFSNEFVDAFPVRRLRFTGDEWRESWVLPDAEEWRPLATRDPALPSSALTAHPWSSPQIVEVHESYRAWLEENLPLWKAGRMLTIDYGSADPAALLHRRPLGTLRGYFHHQLIEGPELLARPGQQDLTADVCFADLEAWSAPWARTRRLIAQHEFLQPFADPADPGDRYALDPAGPGGAFLVLEQEPVT